MSVPKEQDAASSVVPFDPSASKVYLRMKSLEDWIARTFDTSPLGILRIGLDFRITYANKKAMDICGIASFAGRRVLEFVPDEKTIKLLKEKLANRQKGLSEEYETEIVREYDGRRIPVTVAAMPSFDRDGNVSGAVSIFRTLELERASQAINHCVQTSRTSVDLLRAVAEQTKQVISFDACSVSIYSSDLEHARVLFTDSQELAVQTSSRWFQVTPLLRAWAQHTQAIIVPDATAFLQSMDFEEGYLQEVLANFRRFGWSSFLRYPIVREGRVIGSFVLTSKQLNAYTEDDRKRMMALPLDTALATALHYDEVHELEFRLALVRDVLLCKTNADIFDMLVNRLVENYGWESVAVLRINEGTQKIALQTQKSLSGNLALPVNYEQGLHDGVLGHVYRTGADANIRNVCRDPRFINMFLRVNSSTVSELCMPIRVGGAVYALLNIEDSKENAFAPEEVDALRLVLSEVETVIERFRNDQLIAATYDATPAAVWIIDNGGNVRKANPAAQDLVGFTEGEQVGKSLVTFFKDKEIGKAVVKARDPVSREVTLVNRSGVPTNVLLGGSQLGADFAGECIITARDLRGHKRTQEIEFLDQIFYEVATQVKTPLALSFSWLRRLMGNSDTFAQDVLEKTLQQLKRAEITYDRLALFEGGADITPYHEMPLDVGRILQSTLSEFPTFECDCVVCEGAEESMPLIFGDPYQLSFVFRSLLSYLLRFETDRGQIRLGMHVEGEVIAITASGPYATVTGSQPLRRESDQALLYAISEIALGEKVIKKFISNHRGKYYEPKVAGDVINFRIELPIPAKTEK